MTVWPDQPPLSRRQVRESERGLNASTDAVTFAAEAENDASAPLRGSWQPESRRVTVPQGSPLESALVVEANADSALVSHGLVEHSNSAPGSGRRAQALMGPPILDVQGAEALGQPEPAVAPPTRPWVPSYDAPSFRNRSIATDHNDASFGEGTNGMDVAADAAAQQNAGTPPQLPIPEIPAPVPAPDPVYPSADPTSDALPTDRPLTRRELRARGLGGFGPPTTQMAVIRTQGDQAAEAGAVAATEAVTEAATEAVTEAATEAPAQTAFERMLFPGGTTGEADADAEPQAADRASTTFDLFGGGNGATTVDAAEPEAYVPPVGHWSRQAEIDDSQQVQDSTFGRDVAATSGALTTSALVLPSIPTAEDIMGPLSGTGEILITGSISLPSSIGSTGVQPARYDHSDVDALIDADDREDAEQDSAPVRAIRAVSTSTSSGDVIISMKPRKTSKLPMVIIIACSVLIVGVVVLLVLGASLGLLQ